MIRLRTIGQLWPPVYNASHMQTAVVADPFCFAGFSDA